MRVRTTLRVFLLLAVGASAVAYALSRGVPVGDILSLRAVGALVIVAVAAGFLALFVREENREGRMNIERHREAAHGRFVMKAGCLVVAAGLLASVLAALFRG